jgi:hypothetical protein
MNAKDDVDDLTALREAADAIAFDLTLTIEQVAQKGRRRRQLHDRTAQRRRAAA